MFLLSPHPVREITLAELETVFGLLCAKIERAGFRPESVVYLETAARLPALAVCERFGVPAVGVRTRRRGTRSKHRLAFVLRQLPRPLTNALRWWEARLAAGRRPYPRTILQIESVQLPRRPVLVLDDAADTGSSVRAARHWVLSQGIQPQDIRVAVLTVTSILAAEFVDFWLYRDLCRFPWSSDSRDLPAYRQLFRAARLPAVPARPLAQSAKELLLSETPHCDPHPD